MFPWEEYVSGLSIQRFFLENADLCAYLAFGYLGMVRYGPGIATKLLGPPPAPLPPLKEGGRPRPAPDPLWVKVFMMVWNFLLSAFSIFGAMVMVPALLEAIRAHGLHDTVCRTHLELNYTTPCGSWMGMFVASKVPELVDTLVLIIQKRKTPSFLQWYHHVSVLVFAWMSYSIGNSTMPVFGAMNVFVHAIMYPYFFICACGGKKLVAPFAKSITTLQILQMVGGSALTFYSLAVNYDDYYRKGNDDITKLPCQVNRQTAMFGSIVYVSYLYLFSKMFVEKYISGGKKERGGASRGPGTAATNGNGRTNGDANGVLPDSHHRKSA